MDIPARSWIGFEQGEGGGERVQMVNPGTGQFLEPVFELASDEEVQRVGDLAAAAFPAYGGLDLGLREDFLEGIAQELERDGEALANRFVLETGLGVERARGELAGACERLRGYGRCGAGAGFHGLRRCEEGGAGMAEVVSRRVGVGPVLVLGTASFPSALSALSAVGRDVASALAAGCPVIAVAHHAHAGVAALAAAAVVRAAQRCGMPEGVYSLLQCSAEQARELVGHAGVAAIGFTGSRAGGEEFQGLALRRERPIPVFAGMESVNPVVFGQGGLGAEAEVWAQRVFEGVMGDGGQVCTCPRLLFVPLGAEGDEFVECLTGLFAGAAAVSMTHAGLAEGYRRARRELERVAGVELLAAGAVGLDLPVVQGQAAIYGMGQVEFEENWRGASREVFGPCVLVVRVEGLRPMGRILDLLEEQLCVSFVLDAVELSAAGEAIAAAERRAGRIVFGGLSLGMESCGDQGYEGPYSATLGGSTSCGEEALLRWTRRVAWQNPPVELFGG